MDRNTARLLPFCQLDFAQTGTYFALCVVYLGRLFLLLSNDVDGVEVLADIFTDVRVELIVYFGFMI